MTEWTQGRMGLGIGALALLAAMAAGCTGFSGAGGAGARKSGTVAVLPSTAATEAATARADKAKGVKAPASRNAIATGEDLRAMSGEAGQYNAIQLPAELAARYGSDQGEGAPSNDLRAARHPRQERAPKPSRGGPLRWIRGGQTETPRMVMAEQAPVAGPEEVWKDGVVEPAHIDPAIMGY